MNYTLKHALLLGLGLILGLGAMAFTDVLHPVTPFRPGSLVLDPGERLPETLRWIDPQFGFETRHPTGLLEVRWYCVYEEMNGLDEDELPAGAFQPQVVIEPPTRPADGPDEAFYFEQTRVHTEPCPVFRFGPDYPGE